MRLKLLLISALLCPGLLSAQTETGFDNGKIAKYWQVESESPDYRLSAKDGICEITAPKGLTMWYRQKMSGNVVIEYDAKVFNDREGDRLSDMNCFWMASDPKAQSVFSRLKDRNGVFANCSSMRLYYVGYGGNGNTTTRFRRYDGNPDPALVKEYTDADHLLEADRWYHVKLVAEGEKIQYWLDGRLLFDYRDSAPYREGWFGFRTTLSRTAIKNFSYKEWKDEPFAKADLHWVGEAPASDRGVSFGVPFKKGEVTEKTALELRTADGQNIPTDQWAMAKWPDGSLKWLGVAAVIPGGTEKAEFVKVRKDNGARQSSMTEDLPDSYRIATGKITAVIPKSGESIISALYVGDTMVGAAADLVASEGGREYVSKLTKVSLEQNGAVRSTVKVEGTHSGNGRDWLPFTVRLYFYKNSDQIRIVHSFVFDGDADKDFISSLGIRFRIPMREEMYNRHVAFVGDGGSVWAEPVEPLVGRRVLMAPKDKPQPEKIYQEQQMEGKRIPQHEFFDEKGQFLIEKWAKWDSYRLSQLTDNSYSIRKKTQEDRPWIGTVTGDRAAGYAFAGDVSGGLGVFLKNFWQLYPSTLEVKGARSDEASLTVWFWSPESEPMDLRHYDTVAHDLEASYEDVQEGMSTPYGIGKTNILTVIPMASYPGKEAVAADAGTLLEDAQFLPSPEYLHEARAFGIWSLPDRSNEIRNRIEDKIDEFITLYEGQVEEFKWYGLWNYGDFMHSMDDVRGVWRYDVGGFAWDNTELASNLWLWYVFLRSGRHDVWELASAMSRHTTEVDSYHIGEYKGLGSRHNVTHWGCGAKEARIGQAEWNRFLYYLTTDERSGDLAAESKDAEQILYKVDPMRLAAPRSIYPCTAPARLRIGPDWLAYAGNWMTQYERTGDPHYRDMVVTGMKSIAALPQGFLTGKSKALGFYPDTGRITYEGDPDAISTNHLMTIMGGFEVAMEMKEMFDVPEFWKAWLDHARKYHEINGFGNGRLDGYAAYMDHDPQAASAAWERLLKTLERPAFRNTNGAATWNLDTIYLLEVLPL